MLELLEESGALHSVHLDMMELKGDGQGGSAKMSAVSMALHLGLLVISDLR